MKTNYIELNGRRIGHEYPAYIVAEMSANHNQSFENAVNIVKEAKKAGADAIKLQTYKPDTMTIESNNNYFRIKGTPWDGSTLYELYSRAYTPWEWHPKLKEIAESLDLDFFSTPFDITALDFLNNLDVPVFKIASFENIDIPFIQTIASVGKPIIISTGMATLDEIDEIIKTLHSAGNNQIALLKCTSAYPAPIDECNLKTIPDLRNKYKIPIGLSDHTLGFAISIIAVSLGACIIEKHFTLSRSIPSPDSTFSLEPVEFKEMVKAVRETEKAIGKVVYGISENEKQNLIFRRSLFVVKDINAGERITHENVRSIRPGYGLAPRNMDKIISMRAKKNIKRGTPLSWELVDDK